ncbi:hypothetical protein BFJ63_vAg17419 [Fusarium oxysporum f. sp. narcissi]|uniref:Uncharacterized protein n=1 Tax=Fusarium oxysporum f. sp. narcissi TaxID=451672 RepID=A0A4Q2UYX8_FUSOX|nr:hypothetical protein BFJ63_vAg17419 [Fusarium oxysporum f. sp. narcissi]
MDLKPSAEYDSTSEDMAWDLYTIVIWATVEVNLVAVSGTIQADAL